MIGMLLALVVLAAAFLGIRQYNKNASFNDGLIKIYHNGYFQDLNEDFIYEKFPDRMNNIYARSIKYIIPFEHYINTQYGMSSVINSFIFSVRFH